MTATLPGPAGAAAPASVAARDPRAPFPMASGSAPLRPAAAGFDRVLAGAALALALIGALLVWAATRNVERAAGGDPQSFLYRHLVNIVIAAALLMLTARLDARVLRLFGPVVYLASLLGLLAVFAVGSTINGAHAWIRLGAGFEIQPAEFMKLGLIVGLAVLFSGEERRAGPPGTREVVRALILIAVPLAMIMAQPDLGSAMVLGFTALAVLIAAGVRARWTVGLVVLAVVVAVVAVKAGLLADYQLARFTAFAHPHADVQGAAYNVTQAHIALAHGGLFGTGLFRGPQTNGGFVPEQQTDFVFSVAGEEFGLVGSLVIVALFAVLCWRGLRIARAAGPAGRLVAVGVVCWLAFQTFQNIGMNLGLTPVTGLPLPFVSYGGSSMFAQGLAIGLLQAVRRTRA